MELSLIDRSKASERRRRHHKRRLMKSGVTIKKTRRPRVLVAGAGCETNIHRGFPCMNTSLERCCEVGNEDEGEPHSVLVLDVFYNGSELMALFDAHLTL